MLEVRSTAARLGATCLAALSLGVLYPAAPRGASPDLVISQIYGGAGSASTLFTHDYIEIFNRGTAPVPLDGYSLQYASATGTGLFAGTSTQLTELPAVTLQPGRSEERRVGKECRS